MKKSFFVLRTEIFQTFRQTKILLILFFLILLYESILSPMKTLCEDTQFALHFFEPFILLCTKSTNIILIPLIYMILLGNFPYCKKQYFQMVRVGKQYWFWGEFSFIVLSAFIMILILLTGSILFLFGHLKFTYNWSNYMTAMRENFPILYAENPLLFLDSSIIAHGKPSQVLIYSFGMMWLYLIIIGICTLYGTIIGKRMLVLIAAVSTTVIGGSSIYFGGAIQWAFPLVHAEFGLHYDSLFSKVYFPLWGSVLYLFALLVVLIILCQCCLKTMRIGDES